METGRMEDDARLPVLEKEVVIVQCRGIDSQGRRCTRTRTVTREKLYRLSETKQFCHRHTTTRTKRRRRRNRRSINRRALIIVTLLVAVGTIGMGVITKHLWMCLLGLVVLSLVSLCGCVVVAEMALQAAWMSTNSTVKGNFLVVPSHSESVSTDSMDEDDPAAIA